MRWTGTLSPLRWSRSVERHPDQHRGGRNIRVHKSGRTPRFLPVHPTGQYSKECPQVGFPVALSKRHAKIRRNGYRRPAPLIRFTIAEADDSRTNLSSNWAAPLFHEVEAP